MTSWVEVVERRNWNSGGDAGGSPCCGRSGGSVEAVPDVVPSWILLRFLSRSLMAILQL